MSEAPAGGIEIDEIRLNWDEITEIAGDLVDVQGGGLGGLQWAKSAREVLSEVGLTRYVLEVGRTVCILRLSIGRRFLAGATRGAKGHVRR